ncbi:MAG: flagellar FlbD family protein [bacterium]
MIALTQLNGACVYVNSSLIETFERTPDTVITLTTGRKLIVRESPEEVIDKVMEFAAKVSESSVCAREGVA